MHAQPTNSPTQPNDAAGAGTGDSLSQRPDEALRVPSRASRDGVAADEVRFREIAEESNDMISRHSRDGAFIYVSPASTALLGFEPDELLGMSGLDLAHPDDREGVLALLRDAAARNADAATTTCRIRRKDGSYVWAETTDRLLRDPETLEISGYQSITRDVSERHAVEDALRASEERFRQIFERSHVGLALVGRDLHFLGVNAAFCQMVEYTEAELLSRTAFDITHPDDMELTTEAADRERNVVIEKRYITKTGRTIWVSVNATVVRSSGADPWSAYSVAIVEEITHRKRADEELRDLATLKSEFLALASHELRAPLTTISGGLELIADDAEFLPQRTRRAIEIVGAESLRLTVLVESILDVSRLDHGQLPLTPGAVAVKPLVARVIGGMDVESRVDIRMPGGLPPVWMDEVHLGQTLRNVLENAGKYSDERIMVSAREHGDQLTISIVDGGPGVPPDEQARIFDPFFRSARTSGTADGYGLGLYFAKRLLEAQSASISVRSPASDDARLPGTAFDIVMPIARAVR